MAVLRTPSVLLRSALTPLAVLSWPVVLWKSALLPLAVLLSPSVLLKSARAPLAVLAPPVVLALRALLPIAVLPSPVLSRLSAWKPNAVLSKPPAGVASTLTSAPVPPAVLLCPSLTVGLQPGATQTGWPQLGVLCSMRASPVAIARRRAIEFMESSVRRTIRQRMGIGEW